MLMVVKGCLRPRDATDEGHRRFGTLAPCQHERAHIGMVQWQSAAQCRSWWLEAEHGLRNLEAGGCCGELRGMGVKLWRGAYALEWLVKALLRPVHWNSGMKITNQ